MTPSQASQLCTKTGYLDREQVKAKIKPGGAGYAMGPFTAMIPDIARFIPDIVR